MPSKPTISPNPATPVKSGYGGTSNVLRAIEKAKNLAVEMETAGGPPWSTDLVDPTRFFFPIDIVGDRWNKAFPYRFVVIDTSNGNSVVFGPTENAKVQISAIESGGVISFERLSPQWQINLPITPDQLNIADQFSISTSATLRGILEEHNGVKFKMISATGTFGVWPSRASLVNPPGTPSIVQSLFGGTIEALGKVKDSAQSVIRTATTGHPASKPRAIQPEDTPDGLASTGYYQALAVQQFLEQYAEQKKNPVNAGWRLVFDIPKQNQSFIVTPMSFVWQQNKERNLQINYSLQLKAWRRINLKESVTPAPSSIQQLSPGMLQRAMATISASRRVVSSSLTLIRAVRSDVTAPIEALRQTHLFLKDLAGAVVSGIDLPSQIIQDFQSAYDSYLKNVNVNDFLDQDSNSKLNKMKFRSAKNSSSANEGLSKDAVASGQLGKAAVNAQALDPSNDIYTNANANFDIFNQIPLSGLTLSVAQQDAVDEVVETARATTVDDLRQFRAVIQGLALQISDNFGTGDAFYNQVYGLPAPTVRLAPITLDGYEILNSLYNAMQVYDILTATTQLDDEKHPSNMEYVAGLASESGIPFSIPNSMILAPVPFGLTVEAISQRYLGDPQRWLEIVTLNNLRDPYIDEDGFQRTLLSNANGRQVTISDVTNMFLGQRVVLHSSAQSPSARAILGIDKLSETSFLITLDGAPNLDGYLTVDQAYLQAYLPGTVNSQQKIFIPSDLSVPNDPHIVVPASTSVDPLTGMSKVDLLLTDDGDLAVNNFGDFRYSYGMTNIVQALKIKFGTVAGTSLLHPKFGLGVRPGTINGDINAQQIFDSINRMIKQDARFAGVSNLQVSLNGPTLTINLAVILANKQGIFPITFQVTK